MQMKFQLIGDDIARTGVSLLLEVPVYQSPAPTIDILKVDRFCSCGGLHIFSVK